MIRNACAHVGFGGGPLPKEAGDLLASDTRLMNVLGSPECAVLPSDLLDPENWQYFNFSPFVGFQMRPHSDNLYERVIFRDKSLELFQAVFATLPHLQEFPMNDLYSKHPTKEDLWLWKGDTDDIIVLANGEKQNPTTTENIVGDHATIKSALVCGQSRLQCSSLLEPYERPVDDQAKSMLLDNIRENKDCPVHGQITKDMIILKAPGKPVIRAGKSTVQRKSTVDSYQEGLNLLYSCVETPRNGATFAIDGQSQEALVAVLT